MQKSSSGQLRTMVARVSPNDIVIYANGALASYLRVRKKELIGTPLDVVAQRCKGEIASCFARPETGRTSNHLVTDDEGRVFEAKLYTESGVLDIVLDEVTTAEAIGRELRDSSGTAFDSLSEDELRTARHPERRYLTVSFTHLRGVSQVTERLPAMEVRLMVNSFVEEACDAVFETGCTVGETTGDSVLGIFGAPRYFTDHPLRAIRSACAQMQKASQLHAGFYREGKEFPPSACGIWTGDSLVGTIGNSIWQHYTAVGAPVEFAERLCQLARPGEVILPEHTLTHLLRVLPEGWEHLRAESEFEPDLSDFQWSGDEIAPVPEHLRKVVYLVGPGVKENTERVEFYFDYLWAFRVPGRDQVIPILRVVRPSQVGDSVELRDDNVVTGQAVQTLGKYKLIEVIGAGGMGKVWRGVDRFGNSVAIKVLHSNETVTEAQIKRFRREAEVMGRLPHRNICRVYEMNEFDGIQYIAMEFVDGLPLSDLLYEKAAEESSTNGSKNKINLKTLISAIRTEKSRSAALAPEVAEEEALPERPKNTRILPVEQTLSIMLRVCEAVQFAHEHGVLHRDLKPGNILLREDGEPLVADFGLAKLNTAEATHSLSMTGHVVGTLENMSPEQAESSKDVDERADVYALGTILYQMLTGRRHFEATGNIVADAQALKDHEPVRLRAHNSHIDPDLEIITLKALRNDPAERYRSVAALVADLEHYRRGEVISAKPVSPMDLLKKMIQRNKAVSISTAVALVTLIGVVVFFFWKLSERQVELKQQLAQTEEQKKLAQERGAEAERRKIEAEQQRSEAERQSAEAEKQAAEANKQRSVAEEQSRIARDTLQKLQEVQEAEKVARLSGEKAAEETKEERDRRETAERLLAESQKQIDQMQSQPAPKIPFAAGPGGPPPGAPMGNSREVMEAMRSAEETFNLSVSDYELSRTSPEDVQRRLSQAMDQVTHALLLDPGFTPAWMLKGRLHLALMEYERAEESFAQAATAAQTRPMNRAFDDPQAELELTRQLAAMVGADKYAKGGEMLGRSRNPLDQTAGRILTFLASKPNLRRSLTSSAGPLNRPLSPDEAALALLGRNAPGTQVFVKPGSNGAEVMVWGAGDLSHLEPLKDVTLGGLAVVGASRIDWATIYTLSVKSLDLSKCNIEALPVTQRGLLSVKSLRLSGSSLTTLDFVRGMPLLENLDISDTNVTDVSVLGFSRSLRVINLGGLNPANLRSLAVLPLQSLTVSPMLITDRASLNALRQHRTLKILRAPGDPDDQPAAEFWAKLDRGMYDQAN